MPLPVHLELWRAAPRRLLRQSRYAALLTSMHGVRLYGLRDPARLSGADAAAIRAFVDAERSWQDEIARSLRVESDELRRNSQLVWTWDDMSLALCLGWPPCTVADVPTAGEPAALELRTGESARQVVIEPWPFRHDGPFTVRVEGQRLSERVDSQDALAEAIAAAPWETLEIELTP
jgi:hypothetical protein